MLNNRSAMPLRATCWQWPCTAAASSDLVRPHDLTLLLSLVFPWQRTSVAGSLASGRVRSTWLVQRLSGQVAHSGDEVPRLQDQQDSKIVSKDLRIARNMT